MTRDPDLEQWQYTQDLFLVTGASFLLFCTRMTYAGALEDSLRAELELYIYYSIGDQRQWA